MSSGLGTWLNTGTSVHLGTTARMSLISPRQLPYGQVKGQGGVTAVVSRESNLPVSSLRKHAVT